VRASAVGYFTKPVDIVLLTDKLDSLTAHGIADDYRILIV